MTAPGAGDDAAGRHAGRRDGLLVLAIWGPIGGMFAYTNVLMLVRAGLPVTPRNLGGTLVALVSMVLLTRISFITARRWPLAGRRFRAPHVGRHAAMMGAAWVVYTAFLLVPKADADPAWRSHLVPFVALQFPPVALSYVIGAGLMTALLLREEIHRETVRAVSLSEKLTRTELAGLQARLRPAFFFESLDAISWLIPRDPDAADAAIARLGAFLRYSLDVADVPEVPLEEEVHALRAYLHVLTIRSARSVSVSVSVDDEAMAATVPPLLLQPLVDDALRRAGDGRGAQLRIDGGLDRDGLVLRLSSCAALARAAGEHRPAMQDVRRRLRHLYGEGEHLSVHPLPDGGEVATLVIPSLAPLAGADGRGTLTNER